MPSHGAVDRLQPRRVEERIEHILPIKQDDGGGNGPAEDFDPERVGEFAHFCPIVGEAHERPDGKAELQAERHLAGHEQIVGFGLAVEADDENGGDDGDGAGDQTAEPGPQPDVEKSFHDNLAGEGAGERRVLARGEQAAGKERAGKTDADHRAKQSISALNIGHIAMARIVESGGGEDEDGGIDEGGPQERERRIERAVADGFPLARAGRLDPARLHDGGMEVEIMGHDRGTDDANADVEEIRVAQDFRAGGQAREHAEETGPGQGDFDGKAEGDGRHENDDERLQVTEALVLQVKNGEDIETGEDAAEQERDAEKELQADGHAHDFRQIAGGDGQLAENPEEDDDRRGIAVAARLGEIAASGNSELEREMLQEDGHEIGHQNDAQERIPELRATGEIGRPVAGVHVADGDDEARAEKSAHFAPDRLARGHGDAAVDLGQRGRVRGAAPGAGGRGDRLG